MRASRLDSSKNISVIEQDNFVVVLPIGLAIKQPLFFLGVYPLSRVAIKLPYAGCTHIHTRERADATKFPESHRGVSGARVTASERASERAPTEKARENGVSLRVFPIVGRVRRRVRNHFSMPRVPLMGDGRRAGYAYYTTIRATIRLPTLCHFLSGRPRAPEL